MAHITADRVRDTTTTTGTGALTVSGSAPNGYRTFSGVASTSDTFYYAVQHQAAAEWEVGLGTYSSSNTITRTTVYSSSNSGSAVDFSAGTKDIFITLPASRTVQKDNTGNITGLVIGTDVQAYSSGLTSWASKTAPTGTVVGTSDTQTLTNKTLTSPTLTTPTATGLKETKVAVSASDIDLTAGNYFTKTISGSTTFTVSNVPSTGTAVSFVLELTNPGTSVTWWSGVKWAGGTAPTLTASGKDAFGFYTHDGGTTWNGIVLGKDLK